MAILTVEAIILKVQPFRNTSLIITVFTKDRGKMHCLAKGARSHCSKKGSKYNCYLQPLTLNKIIYYENNRHGLHILAQCDLLDHFQPIRQDLTRLASASFLLELVDKATQLHDSNPDIFELLIEALGVLCTEKDIGHILLLFEIRFLSLIGLTPQVRLCARCGKKFLSRPCANEINLDLDEVKFSSLYGGLICKYCNDNNKFSMPISRGAIASMLHVTTDKWTGIKRFKLSDKITDELKGPLRDFIKVHINDEFQTLNFMNKIGIAL